MRKQTSYIHYNTGGSQSIMLSEKDQIQNTMCGIFHLCEMSIKYQSIKQRLANIFWKGWGSKYFRLWEPYGLYSMLPLLGESGQRLPIDEETWLHSNITVYKDRQQARFGHICSLQTPPAEAQSRSRLRLWSQRWKWFKCKGPQSISCRSKTTEICVTL